MDIVHTDKPKGLISDLDMNYLNTYNKEKILLKT